MPKISFSQLPKLKKILFGVELALAHQVIKKLKMDHLWVDELYPLHAATATECDKKTKRACQLLKF